MPLSLITSLCQLLTRHQAGWSLAFPGDSVETCGDHECPAILTPQNRHFFPDKFQISWRILYLILFFLSHGVATCRGNTWYKHIGHIGWKYCRNSHCRRLTSVHSCSNEEGVQGHTVLEVWTLRILVKIVYQVPVYSLNWFAAFGATHLCQKNCNTYDVSRESIPSDLMETKGNQTCQDSSTSLNNSIARAEPSVFKAAIACSHTAQMEETLCISVAAKWNSRSWLAIWLCRSLFHETWAGQKAWNIMKY